MLHKLLLNRPKIFFPYQLQSTLKYCTHHEAIESILRTELRIDVDKFLIKNSFLFQCQPNEMRKSIKRLKRLNFRASDIQINPRILLQTEYQLLNTFQRFQEVGFKELTAFHLTHAEKFMSKSVDFNQRFNFLPKNINVFQHIFATANIPLGNEIEYDPQMKLRAVHRMALRNYMLNQIKFKDAEIDAIWRNYPTLKMQSLQTLAETAQLLEKTYQLPVHKLPKYLLAKTKPEETNEIMNADTLKGFDVRQIMSYTKKINLKRLEEIQIQCRSYKISKSALKYTPRLFALSLNLLKQRAEKIEKLKDGKEFLEHVAVGRLIVNMGCLEKYAESKQIDFDNIFTDSFVDYFLNGRKQGNDMMLFYLCNEFKKGKDEIQKSLQVHPHWKTLKFPDVHANIKYLLTKHFTHEDIFNDLPIILYSTIEIKAFFNRLRDPEEMKRFNIVPEKLKKSQTLQLCIYFIEKKCNFNNEGIFLNADTRKYEDDQIIQFEEILESIRLLK